jgi:hypothetical protein
MKKLLFVAIAVLLITACGQKGNQNTQVQSEQPTEAAVASEAKVVVYYFHGKQRCKTCLAVQEIAQKTVTTQFGTNPEVQFIEVDITEATQQNIVDKFEVTWSSLILATNDNHTDITDQAFSMALANPQGLADFLTEETNKMLIN